MIFQLHIQLLGIKPLIWRRIQVKSGITLHRLDHIIQNAMGWGECHLTEFEIDGMRYGDSELEDFDTGILETRKYKVTCKLLKKKQVFKFIYDFGDNWQHKIKVEDIFEPEIGVFYPRCIDGARACPQEDTGGPFGYKEYLEALIDPNHERHEELIEWGGDFDPEYFDKDEVNEYLKNG